MKVQIAGQLYEVEFRDGITADGMPIDGVADHGACLLIIPKYLTAQKLAKVVDSAEREARAVANVSNTRPAKIPRLVGSVD